MRYDFLPTALCPSETPNAILRAENIVEIPELSERTLGRNSVYSI